MSAVAITAARPSHPRRGALDRDGDPLWHVPAPGQHSADQRVVDAELLAFFAIPLLGCARGRIEEVSRPESLETTSLPMSWSRAATTSSSRSLRADLTPDPGGCLLVARAWTRNCSGQQLQLPLGSNSRRPARCRRSPAHQRASKTSIAAGMPPMLPRLLARLAKRRTAIVRATSASTASTDSPTPAVSAVAACITRARDSIKRRIFSTASKAAARRVPGRGARRHHAARRPSAPFRCSAFCSMP